MQNLLVIYKLIVHQLVVIDLQNIAINPSADIDYKDFIKIYRACTKEPFNFLTIDTTRDKKFIKNFDESL